MKSNRKSEVTRLQGRGKVSNGWEEIKEGRKEGEGGL